MLGNPLDSQSSFWDAQKFAESIRVFARWQGIDLLILHLGVYTGPSAKMHIATMRARREAYVSAARECNRPVAMVLHSVVSSAEGCEEREKWQRSCNEARLPLYSSIGRAANAINKFIKYHEEHRKGK